MMHRVAERSGQPRQSLDAANADALNELATLATTLSSLSSTQTDGLESPTLSSSITFLRNINAFLPISRLPSEILICVLELSTSHSRRKSGTIVPSDRLMELYTLMKLTHICHHWREVAINRQSLWAHLSSWMPQELIDLFLERAGDGPFNIRVSQFPDRLLNSLGTRARTLYLTYPTPYLSSDKLLEYLAFPAPQLEFLTVHQTGLRQSHIQAEVKASPELFSGGALRLRVLSLNRTRWLPYNCCQNLTRLYLHPDGTPAWSLRDLIAFLQGCPKLHTFSLTRCSWPDSSDDLHSPFVRLASLRMLYLGLPSKATSSLSRCLVLPTPSSVYIRTMDNARGDYASFDGCSRLLPRGDFERLHCSYTALGYSSIELVVTVAGAAHVITAEVVPVPELGMSKMGIEEDDRGTCHIWPSALLENLDVQEVRELWIEACFSGFPGMLVASPTWYAGAGISDGRRIGYRFSCACATFTKGTFSCPNSRPCTCGHPRYVHNSGRATTSSSSSLHVHNWGAECGHSVRITCPPTKIPNSNRCPRTALSSRHM
ncbi:hypothetical protein OBBRIDRAFT_548289 [Obba rivulosa]|uniref:F-box domain-containing protein n=1 Tax=Obba rivulosa TaxID=1052685 RepID=A0A8E2AZS5_9APHY|nr:hypothetical protein OBBRIDRAFT_548289 [Obba rivulosa]